MESPKGPYQHFERPKEGRAAKEHPSSGHGWSVGICIIIIILVALLPVVHHLSVKNIQHPEQAQEVQRVSKKSSVKKHQTVVKKKRHKQKQKANSSNLQNSNSSSSSKTAKTYVVKQGDTLSSIAENNNMSVSDLMRINNLTDSSSINAGQTLKLK